MKKDNLSVWNHSGSHDKKFECRFGPDGWENNIDIIIIIP